MRLRGTVQKRPAQRISLSDKPRRRFRAINLAAAVMAAVLTVSVGIGAYAADAETEPPIKYTVMESGSEDSAAESSIGQMSDVDKLQGAKYPDEEAARKNAQEAQEEEAAGTTTEVQGEEAAGTEETAQGEETAETAQTAQEEEAAETAQDTQAKGKKLVIWVPKTDYYDSFESIEFLTKSADQEGTKSKTTAYFVTLTDKQPVSTNEGEYYKFSFNLGSDDDISLEAFGISSNEEEEGSGTQGKVPLEVERGELAEVVKKDEKDFPWLIVIAAAGVLVIALIVIALVLSRRGKKPKKEEYSALKEAISCERPSELRVYELKANGAPAVYSFEMTDRGARQLTELENHAGEGRMSFLKKTKLANTTVKAAGKELHIMDAGKRPEEVLCVLNEAHSVVELEAGEGSTLRLIWIPGTRADG